MSSGMFDGAARGTGGGAILITRPEEQAQAFAQALKGMGYTTLTEPMLTINSVPFTPPDLQEFQALVFTSVNAVRFFAQQSLNRHIPVFCVGDKTAEVAKSHGYSVVYSASGAGEGLAHLIVSRSEDRKRPLLHPRAADIAVPLQRWLAGHGMTLVPLIVYKAEKTRVLSPVCQEALLGGRIAMIPFFSKRTAESFLALVQELGLTHTLATIKALSISASVVQSVQSFPWLDVCMAKTPDQDGIIELIRRVSQ